ncbi:hypothetical protein [Streptomyces sp. NRRL S-350]|uniref:hypothetical protein n=1 Tax=Streptomyces sp. NRRL S-350 TaxID=1463902 RepID=UPI000689C6EE|nr:hypothetical protein [Streptomyces sp. NRRL S-350]
MTEQPSRIEPPAAEPEFRRVAGAVVPGRAADVPHRVPLAPLVSCTAITPRTCAERTEWPPEAVRARLGYVTEGSRSGIPRWIPGRGGPAGVRRARARLLDICERTPATPAPRAGVAIDTTEDRA